MEAESPGSLHRSGDNLVAEAAARWLARRDRGLTPDERVELRRWEASDPRHAAELARLEASWQGFDLARAAPELVAMAARLDRRTRARPHRMMPAWTGAFAATAAGLALVASVAYWQLAGKGTGAGTMPAPSYRVLASTAERIVFDDGSIADVREGSDIRAEFTGAERRVRLVCGEAHFTVARDAARPFIVDVGTTAVRAVGTAFNVRLDEERVEVLVTEGKVQVANAERPGRTRPESSPIVAGQRAVVERATDTAAAPSRIDVTTAAPAEMERTLAWQSPRLVFDYQ